VSSLRQDATRERIETAIAGPLTALELDVEAVEITPAGKRRILRIALDKDGGVTLDDVAEATREISRLLDESDAMGEQPDTLEVTSRGVDRPLTLPRHWRRNADRLVKVTTTDGETIEGRIATSDDAAACIHVGASTREISYADITRAQVQVELNRRGAEEG
jgi:ribosome maturation factor RimP